VEDCAAGYVGMGDRYGNKNGAMQNFLVDSVRFGARIFESCHVDKINIATTSTGRRATGVECTVTYDDLEIRHVRIHARRSVVSAAGALHTPCLLRKSGLRNSHIGKHLRLHPVSGVMGFYPSDDRIDSIRGAPMTTVCSEFANGPEKNGYGAKIECPCSYPGLLAAASPWISAQVFKERVLKYSHCVPLIALQRDSGDGGTVKQSLDGKSLVIDYKVNHMDTQSLVVAMQGAAEILVASGAQEVATGHIRDNGFKVPNGQEKRELGSSDDPSLEVYKSSIQNRGMLDHEIGLFSAHQMGTCRMSVSSQQGAVDVNGETWECDDLYVMDASLFPTASGSNPMVTVMTLAHVLSTRLSFWLKLRDHLGETKATTPSLMLSDKERLMAMEMSNRRTLTRSHCSQSTVKTSFVCLAVAPILVLVVFWMR
jgi:choline dehydrogenase-like flavoprotein